MNRNERKRTKDMRVKMYIFSYSFDERKCCIYRVYGITESYQNN